MPAKPPSRRPGTTPEPARDAAAQSTRASAGTPARPVSPLTTASTITIGIAAVTWLVGWLAGNIVGSIVVGASGYSNTSASLLPVWVVALSSLGLWVPQIAALVVVSRKYGSANPVADYTATFKPIDLAGVPIGVLSQLVLLRLLYWPLQNLFPGAFSKHNLEQNARDLYDSAKGGWVVVLVVIIVVAAPLVEELVYRGLLMGAARRRFNDVVALVGVAAFFALIHFRPVEYPGLFAFGLVLGACVLGTGRIGMGIVAHLAFNATALALVAR